MTGSRNLIRAYQRQRGSTARHRIRRFQPARKSPAASDPDDLFATIHEQTESVLGKCCGFYIVTYDPERKQARLAYHVDEAVCSLPDKPFDAALCDAIRQRRPLVNDSFARTLSSAAVNSISVPMLHNGVVYGCIGAYSNHERLYETREARSLVAIGELAALALENASFLAQIEQVRREAERVEEIGRAISASLDLPEVLSRVVDAALELLRADSATVWLLRGEGELEAAMTAGDAAPTRGLVVPMPAALRSRMSDFHKTGVVYESVRDGMDELPHRRPKTRSTLAMPLVVEGQVLGALSIGQKARHHYSDSDLQLLQRLSLNAAIAVANARLHEQIRTLSLTDPLTSLPNRRALDLFLEKEFAAAQRGRRLSVLLFDLDHFKEYNDRMGHQAGDSVLRAFASVLTEQTRAMNLAARYGGDEFMTILADTDRRGAQANADRVMRAVRRHSLLKDAGIRASVGISTFMPEMTSFEDLIRAADRDLYLRKGARKKGIV
ncbi:MAG TPA: diguanylate cyclase [Longimicrobiales bacterium]